jgi:hypothetical protein
MKMAEIHKKTWPKSFQEILNGKKKFELRLADFDLKEGDILILEEYDPETKKYTGRSIKKKVTWLVKWNPTEAYTIENIKKFGFWEIGME